METVLKPIINFLLQAVSGGESIGILRGFFSNSLNQLKLNNISLFLAVSFLLQSVNKKK